MPRGVENPVQAVDRVLGISTLQTFPSERRRSQSSPRHALEGIPVTEFGSLSLKQFLAERISVDGFDPNILAARERALDNYEKKKEEFEDLHKSIQGCEDVLKSVEGYLSTFQSDLGAVSVEIETLQQRSTALDFKLETRKAAEKLLGPLVEDIVIPPTIIRTISEGPIDESWQRTIIELEKRNKDVKKSQVKGVNDLKPLLESLLNKATERIRDFFVLQVKALRSPNINSQVIQQQALLNRSSLYAFLVRRQPQLAEDIRQAYTNTIRWYYTLFFTQYHAALSKLKLHIVDQHYSLGDIIHPSTRVQSTHDPFSLGRRGDIVRTLPKTALPSYAAEETKDYHNIETPFFSFNLALVDNASFEYNFLTTFYSTGSSYEKVSRQFAEIYENVLMLGFTLTKTLVLESHDALGILILVRLTQQLAFILQRRKVPTLDAYINNTNMILWPRFQIILDAHCDSLKRLAASLPSRPAANSSAASAFASLSGVGGNQNIHGPSTAPHPITQRFANFTQGILVLSSEAGDDEPVSNSLARLRREFEAFLAKTCAQFSAGEKGRKDKERFLTNNYSLVLAVIADTKGKLAEEMREHFEASRGILGTAVSMTG